MISGSDQIITCPTCATLNRIPMLKMGTGGICGRCRAPLFIGKPITLTSTLFDSHAGKSDIPLLVYFWAPWCSPCKVMGPAFEGAAGQLEPTIRLGTVDTEAEQILAARFRIQSIPTMMLVFRGREIARESGALPTPSIVAWARRAGTRTFS